MQQKEQITSKMQNRDIEPHKSFLGTKDMPFPQQKYMKIQYMQPNGMSF